MRKENSTFQTKFISEAGSKLKNTDYFAFVELDNYACYCIADGIDQDKQKESAKLAVEEAIRKFLEKPGIQKSCLKRCIKAANTVLKAESRDMRLEASFLMVVTNYNTMRWGSAGNTRLYHVRNGAVKNKSADLSLSKTLADKGKIPQDKIEAHEERHNLYCYLGMPQAFNPVLSDKIKLEDGDTLCLCTKGIWEVAGEAELLDALEDAKEPQEVCDEIEELILCRHKNNLTSYTLACVFADKVYKDPGKRKKIVKRVLLAAIPILLIVIILSVTLYIKHRNNEKKINTMLELKETGIEYIEEQNYTRALEKFKEALEAVKNVKIKENKTSYVEKEELEQYNKASELMVDAEEALDKEDYKQAIHYYELALVQIKNILDFNDTNKQYIEEQRKLAATYLEILQYIQAGDKMDSIDNYEGAANAYKLALELARDIYFIEGKEEASSRLADVEAKQYSLEQEELIEEAEEYAEKAEEKEASGNNLAAIQLYKEAAALYKKGGDKDKAKEMKEKIEDIEDKEETATKDQLSGSAEANITKGDQAFEAGNYNMAMEYYQTAIDDYTQASKTDNIPAIQVKMELVQSKNTATAQQEAQADKYITEAENRLKILDYEAATVLYGLAKEIYVKLDMDGEASYMKQLIAKVEQQIEEQETAQEEQNKSQAEVTKVDASAEETQVADSNSALGSEDN